MILQFGDATALRRTSLLCPKPTFQRELPISDFVYWVNIILYGDYIPNRNKVVL
jgi:hypothetical protein